MECAGVGSPNCLENSSSFNRLIVRCYHAPLFYMKIKGTSIIEIDIDKNEERRITIKNLRDLVDWQENHWVNLKTNKLMEHKSYNSAHSWSEDIILRDATDLEMSVQKIILTITAKV